MKRLIALVLCLMLSAFVRAADAQRDAAAEARIEQELAAIAPGQVDTFRRATAAFDASDYATSIRLYREVIAEAPSFDPALRRLGASLVRSGQRKDGVSWVEKAIQTKRSAANLITLAQILAYHEKGASDADLLRAQQLLAEARTLSDRQDVHADMLAAQVALQRNQIDEAARIVTELERSSPDEVGTHVLAAYVAANQEQWVKADRAMRRAESLGYDPASVQQFLDSGIHSRALAAKWMWGTGGVIAFWAVGLGVLCGTGAVLSRVTLRKIEAADPAVPISAGERRLRQLYRVVLNVAGVYYYVSLPMVVVLLVAAAGAIIYGFMMAGVLPIKLLVILVIGVLATLWSMGRSLFLRVKSEDPGRPLTRDEAPGVWRLAEDVAAAVKTRPVDEIRVTVGTDLCVYERGTWREKLEGKAARILVIGVAVLDGFKQDHFRSVLAHEYGHFANRDTAGGEVALRVRNDIWKFYVTMVQAGQATWLNLAFHFLRFYHFVFRRISHGATRLQEVLADRVAAQAYGAAAFEGGLRHAIRRSLEFDAYADREIKAAIEAERPIRNLYERPATTMESVEQEFEKAMNETTTADDTHPAPMDRFRLVRRVPCVTPATSGALVWDLFSDPEALQREMTQTVEKNILPHRGSSYRPPATEATS